MHFTSGLSFNFCKSRVEESLIFWVIGSQYFLVYKGRKISPSREEFTDCLTVSEWDLSGKLRKFTLKKTSGFLEVNEFQVCNTSKIFYQCMPENWGTEPIRVIEIDPKQ